MSLGGAGPEEHQGAINFLREQARPESDLMSTHSLDIAEEVAERIGIIHHGKLLYDGPIEGLRNSSSVKNLEEIFLDLTR